MFFLLFISMIFILQGVAFFTLVERHMLGLTQNRFGPKKTSFFGLLQPLMDGMKLLSKE